MLTKTSKANRWKYLAVLPTLAICTMAMDSSQIDLTRKRVGNITTFKGNTFEWNGDNQETYDTVSVLDPVSNEQTIMVMKRQSQDTISVVDPASNEQTIMVMKRQSQDRIVRMGTKKIKASTFSEDDLRTVHRSSLMTLTSKVKKAIEVEITLPQKLAAISIKNAVADKNGKVYYYDVDYIYSDGKSDDKQNAQLNLAVDKALQKVTIKDLSSLAIQHEYTFWPFIANIQL